MDQISAGKLPLRLATTMLQGRKKAPVAPSEHGGLSAPPFSDSALRHCSSSLGFKSKQVLTPAAAASPRQKDDSGPVSPHGAAARILETIVLADGSGPALVSSSYVVCGSPSVRRISAMSVQADLGSKAVYPLVECHNAFELLVGARDV